MKYLLLILTALSLSGCTKVIYGMIGMHEPKALSDEVILKYAADYGIHTHNNYTLDSSFISFISSLDTARYALSRKNHTQPLQALYYDRAGQLRVFIINCYAGGFPNLKWNRGGILDTFLPKQQAPADSILPWQTQLRYLKPLPGTEAFSAGDHDYTVVIYWSRFMGRQSRRLIRAIQENTKLAGGANVKLIYVNTDNFFVGKI